MIKLRRITVTVVIETNKGDSETEFTPKEWESIEDFIERVKDELDNLIIE